MSFIITDIEKGLEALGKAFENALVYVANILYQGFSFIWNEIRKFFDYVWNLLVSAFNSFINWIIAQAVSLFNGMFSSLSNLFSQAFGSAINLINGITGWFNNYLLPHLTADISTISNSMFNSIMLYYALKSSRNIIYNKIPDSIEKYGIVKGSIKGLGMLFITPISTLLLEPIISLFINRYITPPAKMPSPTIIPPTSLQAQLGSVSTPSIPTPTVLQASNTNLITISASGIINLVQTEIPLINSSNINISSQGSISIT